MCVTVLQTLEIILPVVGYTCVSQCFRHWRLSFRWLVVLVCHSASDTGDCHVGGWLYLCVTVLQTLEIILPVVGYTCVSQCFRHWRLSCGWLVILVCHIASDTGDYPSGGWLYLCVTVLQTLEIILPVVGYTCVSQCSRHWRLSCRWLVILLCHIASDTGDYPSGGWLYLCVTVLQTLEIILPVVGYTCVSQCSRHWRLSCRWLVILLCHIASDTGDYPSGGWLYLCVTVLQTLEIILPVVGYTCVSQCSRHWRLSCRWLVILVCHSASDTGDYPSGGWLYLCVTVLQTLEIILPVVGYTCVSQCFRHWRLSFRWLVILVCHIASGTGDCHVGGWLYLCVILPQTLEIVFSVIRYTLNMDATVLLR